MKIHFAGSAIIVIELVVPAGGGPPADDVRGAVARSLTVLDPSSHLNETLRDSEGIMAMLSRGDRPPRPGQRWYRGAFPHPDVAGRRSARSRRLRISPTVRWLPSIGFSDADAMAATEANAPPAPTPTPHSPSPEALQAAAKSYAPRDVKARVILVLDPGQVTFLAGYLVTKDGTYHPRSAFFFCLSVQLMERYEEASGISMMLFSWAYKQVRWAMIAAWSELTTDSGGGGGDDPTRCGCRRS